MVPGIKKPASLIEAITGIERVLVWGGVLKSLILYTSLLVHADADLVFSAHLLTCVDKGRFVVPVAGGQLLPA